jgi:hypothetical protein
MMAANLLEAQKNSTTTSHTRLREEQQFELPAARPSLRNNFAASALEKI